MLRVKNLEDLKKYGFENTYKTTYFKMLETDEEEQGLYISLTVNPLFDKNNGKNEIVVEVSYDFLCDNYDEKPSLDVLSRLDVLFEMYNDGVIEYVKEEK